MEKDMTVGNPTKMILNFTIPLFIGNVFQQLYNMADTIIVGKFVGVFDHWFSAGDDCRIYSAYCTEIRSRRYEIRQKNSRFSCDPVAHRVSDHDCDQHGGNEMVASFYEYAG